jgi:hypothetical protein
MVLHQGIGNLGEDQGEHNHQLESKEDLRLGSIRSFQRREVFKSKQDGKKHDPGVKERITNMHDKHAKRKNAEETATRRAEKRQKPHKRKRGSIDVSCSRRCDGNIEMATQKQNG